MRKWSQSDWLSPIPVGTAFLLAAGLLDIGRPWLLTWLRAHYSPFMVSAIGGGITFLILAGFIGLVAYLFGGKNT